MTIEDAIENFRKAKADYDALSSQIAAAQAALYAAEREYDGIHDALSVAKRDLEAAIMGNGG